MEEETLDQDDAPVSEPDNADAVVVPLELAQAVLDYLATRPYREVAAMIDKFSKVRPVNSKTLGE